MNIKGKASGKKHKTWISGSPHELYIILTSLTLAFVVLFTLILVLSRVLVSTERLRLENMIEKNFNNIIFDLQQGELSSTKILSDRNVIGVAIYDTTGTIIASWGRVYNIMPFSVFSNELSSSDTNAVMKYNKDSKVMEYTRYMRLPSFLSASSLLSSGFTSTGVDFSSIMYIAFDGSSYYRRTGILSVCTMLGLAGVVLLYIFVVRIYKQNRSYRQQMVKQENLVNLGQAARTLTHEIKNPLSAITIQIALLKRQLSGEYLDELKLVEHEVQRLIELTNRVSDFLKNPEGQPEQIDMAELVNSLVPLFAYKITVLPSSSAQAYVLFDKGRLRSVIENVLKNAVESCEGRDPQVEVEIVLGRKNMYHLYVRDRGDGIKKSDMEKLFDPFYTTKIHGSGIGLSISRQFLRARGGDIKLYPRSGGGTVVEITVNRYSLVEELVTNGPGITKRNIKAIAEEKKKNESLDR